MQRIGFVVFPGFQLMGFAAVSVFEFTNRTVGEPLYDVHLLSETGGPVPHLARHCDPNGSFRRHRLRYGDRRWRHRH
ncbi:MAG: hypothetical protein WDN49_17240 [Acetobacteraceae bacterium]